MSTSQGAPARVLSIIPCWIDPSFPCPFSSKHTMSQSVSSSVDALCCEASMQACDACGGAKQLAERHVESSPRGICSLPSHHHHPHARPNTHMLPIFLARKSLCTSHITPISAHVARLRSLGSSAPRPPWSPPRNLDDGNHVRTQRSAAAALAQPWIYSGEVIWVLNGSSRVQST